MARIKYWDKTSETWKYADVAVTTGSVSDEQIAKAVEDYMAEHPIEVPESGGDVEVDPTLTIEGAAADAKAVGDAIRKIIGDEAEVEEVNIEFSTGYYYSISANAIGYNISEKKVANASSLYTPNPIDLGVDAVGKKLRIIASKYGTISSRSSGCCESDGTIVSAFQEKEFVYDEDIGNYVMDIPLLERCVYLSFSNTTTIVGIQLISSATDTMNEAYVSVDGSDETGGGLVPFATVSKALEAGYTNIFVKGGVYRERIKISQTAKSPYGKRVSIVSCDPDKRVIFVDPDAIITTSETLVNGYTKVYSALTGKTFSDKNIWIFQDGVPDETTLISDEERHPLERGMKYRCEDTKIERCAATVLADALAEIEVADTYKWFVDSGTIYFSRPQEITEENPLCGSFLTSLFEGFASRTRTLELVGIESKYMRFNVEGMSQATLKDCKSTNVYGDGAFTYDQSVSVEFVRCEAARAFTGTTGDGFNGHSFNTGDPFSKQTTALFVDCWSHDNNDDGYSDHERSETTIIGGLYEYNGKAGVTPAAGSHCTCYNVISRNNYCGFLYTNSTAPEEGGMGGQLTCIGCIAENNNRGGNKVGYRNTGTENSMYLVSCKSIGHDTAYSCPSGKMRLVDCGSLNDVAVKHGNVVVQNTTIVT